MLDRRDNIEPWHVNTCEWILELDEYLSWKSQPRGLLWIKGNPGAGKSTLMAFLFDHFEQEAAQGIRLDFFFSARGTEMQRTPLGMFRSLLCQLFNSDTTARPKLRGVYEERSKQLGNGNWEWSRVMLEKLLADTILESASRQHVTVFIDALDEAGAESAQQLAAYFHRLIDRAGNVDLHVCISCRHYPIAKSPRATEVYMEDHNHDDIAAYIKDTLIDPDFEKIPSEDSEIEQSLVEQLIQQANGSFQWAHLIIPLAQRKISEGESFDEINRWLKEVPHDLEETYTYILCNIIEVNNREQSLLLFQWVWLAEQPLAVPEMRCALAIGAAQSTFPSSHQPLKMANGSIESDERTKRRIKALSGGLIGVVPRGNDYEIVQVIHQSVNDFLRTKGLEILLSLVDTSTLQVDCDSKDILKRSHGALYQSCLACLAGVPAPQGIDYGLSEWRKKLDDDYPLVCYATCYLFVHGEKAPESLLAESLSEEVVDRWVILSSIRDMGDTSYPSEGIKLVHVAAASGLSNLVKSFSNEHIATRTRDETTALHLAAQRGHTETGQVLLEKGADLEARNLYGETPLMKAASCGHVAFVEWLLLAGANIHAKTEDGLGSALQMASERGHFAVVKMLLAAGADMNTNGGSNGTLTDAIQLAAKKGRTEIVQLLLDSGADINAQGDAYGSALQAAADGGQTEIVRLLLNSGADVNAQGLGGLYGNALQAAAGGGYAEIAQLLFNSGADVNAQGGFYGNALQAAIHRGHTEIVQLFLSRGADVNAQGGNYGNALQAAVIRGHIETVQLLLSLGADVNAQGGKYGNALQAAVIRGRIETVQLLLSLDADVNAQGGFYGNALQAAAYGDPREIIHLLLDPGVDVNAQGGECGNALQAVAIRGRPDIMRLLLKSGAKVNSQGGRRGDALWGAATKGHNEIIQLLLEAGADVNGGAKYGYSALQAAAARGHTETVKLLLNAGADINIEDNWYGGDVNAAAFYSHTETAEVLKTWSR